MLLLPIIRNISIRPMKVYTRVSPSGPRLVVDDPSDHTSDDSRLYDIRLRLMRNASDGKPEHPKSSAFIPSSRAFLNEETSETTTDKNQGERKSVTAVAAPAPVSVTASLYSLGGSLLRPFYPSQSAPLEAIPPSTPASGTTTAELPSDDIGKSVSEPVADDHSNGGLSSIDKPISTGGPPTQSADRRVPPADRFSQRLADLRKPSA